MLSIAIIMNNYFHDVATATLLSSAVILWVLDRQVRASGGAAEHAMFARAYTTLTRFAIGALVWIVIGGIPRTIFFTRYEWDPAVIHGIVPALIIKHILMVTAVVVGSVMWVRISKRLKGGE